MLSRLNSSSRLSSSSSSFAVLTSSFRYYPSSCGLFASTPSLLFHHHHRSSSSRSGEPIWKNFARRSKENKMMRENQHFPPPQHHQNQSASSMPEQGWGNTQAHQYRGGRGRGGGGRGGGGRGGGASSSSMIGNGGVMNRSGRPEKYLSDLGRIRVVRSVFQINLNEEADVRSHFATLGIRCDAQQEMCGGLKGCYLDVPIPLTGPAVEQLALLLGGNNNNSNNGKSQPELRNEILQHYSSSDRRSLDTTRKSSDFIFAPSNMLHQQSAASSSNNNNNSQQIEIIYFRCRGIVANSPAVAVHLCYAHAAHVIQSVLCGNFARAFEFGAFVFKCATNPPVQHPGNAEDYSTWTEYTEACRVFANENLADRQQGAIEKGSANYTLGREPIAESMLHGLIQTESEVGRLPACTIEQVSKAVNQNLNLSHLLQIRSGGAWLSVLKMPNHPNLHAIGVSGSKKNSTTMCLLHAVKLAGAYPSIPPEKMAQVRIEEEKKSAALLKDQLPPHMQGVLDQSSASSGDKKQALMMAKSAQSPISIIRHPNAKRMFQLFARIGVSGSPFAHSFWSAERGCYVAKLTGPFLMKTTEANLTNSNGSPSLKQENNNNNNNNNNDDDIDWARTNPSNSILTDESSIPDDSPSLIVTMSADNPEQAQLEAYSRYLEIALKHAPELEKFLSLVSTDDSHMLSADSSDILNVNLNANIVRKIYEADKHLGAPTKEDEEAEAGRLAPEMKLDRAALRLRSHLAASEMSTSSREALAQYMKDQLNHLHSTPKYQQSFASSRAKLPMATAKEQLLGLLDKNRVVVICGTTGCGKTTQVPQYLLDHHIGRGEGPECSILVTQPRRISAISISERIAAERCEEVGDSTGYTIRLDSRPGKSVTLLTTGVLLQLLRVDPSLRGVKYLIIDEIHERDLHCDFSLILAKEALALNPDLRLICMSATLQSETFSKYFDKAPIINVDGMLHPVKEIYLEDLPQLAQEARIPLPPQQQHGGYKTMSATKVQIEPEVVATCVDIAIGKLPPQTSILIFVAGWKDINDVQNACQRRCRTSRVHDYVLLHSSVTKESQMKAFSRSSPDRVKIVIATNIAESGITIDDVGAVIDCGVIKEMSYQVKETNNNHQQQQQQEQQEQTQTNTGSVFTLRSVGASQANCTQRRGRAGRTQGGLCFRLFTRQDFHRRRPYQVPEMLRMPLEQVILQSIAMGHGDPRQFFGKALDVPSPRLMDHSIRQLRALGAIHDDFKLTWLGQWLVKMPTEPATAKMILIGAALRCLDPILTVAAAADAPILVRAVPLREQVGHCRAEIGLTTLSDSCTDVMVVNSIVKDYVDMNTGGRNFNNNNNYSPHTTYSVVTDANRPNAALPVPQPPPYARHVPRELINWRNFDVLKKYKAQFFDVLLSSGWQVSWKNPADQAQQQQRYENKNSPYFVDRSSASENAKEVELIKAVIACSLYPNVALADRVKKGKAKWNCKTKFHHKVPLGSNAVAGKVHKSDVATSLHSRMFTYRNVLDIGMGEFLEDVNHTNIWALLLLAAGEDHITFCPEFGLGIVDGWLLFKSDPTTIRALQTMRVLLNRCFGRLLRNSGSDLDKTKQVLNEVREVVKIVLCQENAENVTHLGQSKDGAGSEDDEDDEEDGNEDNDTRKRQHGKSHHQKGDEWTKFAYDGDDDIHEEEFDS